MSIAKPLAPGRGRPRVAVTSNAPEGDNAPDWELTGDLTLKLRAEREGAGDDRIHTITIRSTDASGNESTATTTMTVPHDQ